MGFLDRLLGRQPAPGSGAVAKERLKFGKAPADKSRRRKYYLLSALVRQSG